MNPDSVLEILAHGAWNGGTVVDNTIYAAQGMQFKGGIPVNDETIQARIGVRERVAAREDEHIGRVALQNLIEETDIDLSRVKLVIGATNVGEDKKDPGPLIGHALARVQKHCPAAIGLDLYAGCPGYNVAVEMILMLSLTGILKKDDLSIIVGAENIHRAKSFRPGDTANIIFGDDAVATLLETKAERVPDGDYIESDPVTVPFGPHIVDDLAAALADAIGDEPLDGLIVDNHMGLVEHRVPAIAARIQHAWITRRYAEQARAGVFDNFRDALTFYDGQVKAFAFDIKTADRNPERVGRIARAYIESGHYRSVVSIFLDPQQGSTIQIHKGNGYTFPRLKHGVIDTATSTHGCFASYIQAVLTDDDVFGEMDGKGVFLYATRGAKRHLTTLLDRNDLAIDDIDLLIEHQANFAMIPMTIQQLLAGRAGDSKRAVADFIARKMVINIHTRGNTSVVCMQRLPYDLARGALTADTIQGVPINRNLEALKQARLILSDSVGAGMMRSSFLQVCDS